jgi:hypothetical protein
MKMISAVGLAFAIACFGHGVNVCFGIREGPRP